MNYATADGTNTYNANSNGGVYYVSKEAFDPTVTPDVDPLIVPENGRFSLSELLFIPPLNVAGELDVGLSIKTKQGSTEQEEATTTAFKLDVAAVADSPELKTPNGSAINLSQPIPKAGDEDEPIDLSNILKATTSGGDTVGTFLVYLKRPDDGSLTDYLVIGVSLRLMMVRLFRVYSLLIQMVIVLVSLWLIQERMVVRVNLFLR